jgi:FkbM family methyltransferase
MARYNKGWPAGSWARPGGRTISITKRLTFAAHEAVRVAQTPRAFGNWARVLTDLALERIGRGPETLLFETRTGLTIECPNVAGARVPVYELFAEDSYHFEWFVGSLRGRPVQVLDIGGHIGTFACRLAQVLPQARIQSYEPSPTTSECFAGNAKRNGLDDRVTVSVAALSDTVGTAGFGDNLGGSGTNGLVTSRPGAGTSILVDTTTFDLAVAALPDPPTIVKMDCEGGEYDLVYASSPESWASVERLVLEYHEVEGQSWPQLRRWFADVGLHVQHEEPESTVLGVAWLSREPLSGSATARVRR